MLWAIHGVCIPRPVVDGSLLLSTKTQVLLTGGMVDLQDFDPGIAIHAQLRVGRPLKVFLSISCVIHKKDLAMELASLQAEWMSFSGIVLRLR